MIKKLLLLPWNIIKFFFRNTCDVVCDLGHLNVYRISQMLDVSIDVQVRRSVITNYLNRKDKFLDEKVDNQAIGFEQIVKELKMNPYNERELLRLFQSMMEDAWSYGQKNKRGYSLSSARYTRRKIVRRISVYKRTLKKHHLS